MATKLESKLLSGRLPLLGKLSSGRQLQILTGALEGFLSAKVLVEGLKRTGKDLNREKFVDTMEKLFLSLA